MLWGSFGIVHIFSLIVAVCLNISLYSIIKNLPNKTQTIVLFFISILGIGAIIFNLFRWNSPLEYLPFHLCSLTAIILPFAIITKNKILNNLLLLWSLGALFALIVNTAQADFEIFSWTFFFYYIPHVFECGIPLIMLKLKHYEKDYHTITSTLIITLVSYTIIHFINLGLNNYFVTNNITDYKGDIIKVNYMFSVYPENPLLSFFYQIIPYPYWYLYLAIPIIVVYLFLIYLKQFVIARKYKYER